MGFTDANADITRQSRLVPLKVILWANLYAPGRCLTGAFQSALVILSPLPCRSGNLAVVTSVSRTP